MTISEDKTVFSFLARRESLTDAEWKELLIARSRLMVDQARSHTLERVGRLRFGSGDPIEEDCKLKPDHFFLEPGLDLQTSAFFSAEPYYCEHQSNRRCTSLWRIWGLTRNRVWIIAQLELHNRMEWRFRMFKSDIDSVLELCNVSAKDVWYRLGQYAKEWKVRRQELLAAATELAAVIEAEEKILDSIPKV